MNLQGQNGAAQPSASLLRQPLSSAGQVVIRPLARQSVINHPTWFEKSFVTATLFFGTGAFSAFSTDPSGTSPVQEDLLSRAIWIGIYLVLLFVIGKRAKTLWNFFLSQPLLVGLLAWVFASTLWSDAPGITIRRAVALLLTTVLGVYIADRFTFRQQMNMLLLVLSAVGFLSLLAGLLFPDVAIMNGTDTAGYWRGIVEHKNQLGQLMAMSIALSSVDAGVGIKRVLIFLLSVSMLRLAHSGGAIVATAIVFMCLPAVWMLRRPTKVLVRGAVAIALALIPIIIYVYIHAEDVAFSILDALGKNSTLSGRGPLWILCLEYIFRRPWFGYGYNAFWLGMEGQYSSHISRVLHWDVPHAHNGFLQLCLDIGLIGLSLYLCVYVAAVHKSVKALRRARTPESMWSLVFLVFFLAANLAQAGLLSGNTIYWITFTSVVYSSHRLSTSLPGTREKTLNKKTGVAA